MATESDILDPNFRVKTIQEIVSKENIERKRESRRRFDIHKGSLHEYVIEDLLKEGRTTASGTLRVNSSINIVPRVIKEKASVYKDQPERTWTDLNDMQQDYVSDIYDDSKVDVMLSKANEVYKLQDQGAVQVIPIQGRLFFRVLHPHHYDVIPREDMPEKPMCYILNIQTAFQDFNSNPAYRTSTESRQSRDNIDQGIADYDDEQLSRMRFAWWTDSYNFITDGFGKIQVPEGAELEIANPILKLPFIDVAEMKKKDFAFWINSDSALIRFQIDFSKDITDATETIQLQAFAQGILVAQEQPKFMNIGPGKYMYLPLDPDHPELRPQFEFKSPSPDIAGVIQMIENKVAMFLTSQDIDPSLISSSGEGKRFNSGLERLLSMFSQFDATRSDFALFDWVEDQAYELIKLWSNAYVGQPELLKGAMALPDTSEVNVEFKKPEMIQTRQEVAAWAKGLLEGGLMSEKRAIMEVYGVEDDAAEEIIEEIEIERVAKMAKLKEPKIVPTGGDNADREESIENGDDPDDRP